MSTMPPRILFGLYAGDARICLSLFTAIAACIVLLVIGGSNIEWRSVYHQQYHEGPKLARVYLSSSSLVGEEL